jgi:hypothetical protein
MARKTRVRPTLSAFGIGSIPTAAARKPTMLWAPPSAWIPCRVAGRCSGAERHPHPRRAFPAAAPGEGEGQEQPGGQLHRGRGDDQGAAAALPLLDQDVETGGEDRQHHQVVVAAADPVEDDHRVQADQHRGAHGGEAAQARRPPDEQDQDQAGGGRDRLVGEHVGGDVERHEQIAERGEERPVGARRRQPLGADQRFEAVQRDRARAVQVRVGVVDGAHPGVGGVAEDVGGEERRGEEDDRVQGEDRDQHRARAQAFGGAGRHRVGDEHREEGGDQGEDAELQARPGERTGQRFRQRPQRGGEEQFRLRRREADEQAGDEEPGEADQAEAGRWFGSGGRHSRTIYPAG